MSGGLCDPSKKSVGERLHLRRAMSTVQSATRYGEGVSGGGAVATRRIPGGFPAKTKIDGHAIERLQPGVAVEVYRFGLGEVVYAQCPIYQVLSWQGRTHRCVRLQLESGIEIVAHSQQWLWVDTKGHVRAEGIDEGDLLRVRQMPKDAVWPLEEVVAVETLVLPRTRMLYLPVVDASGLKVSKRDEPKVGVFVNGILARIC